MRVDRWLWCTRFFKTRALAAEAVKAGHVRVDGQRVKPGKDLRCGMTVAIDKGGDEWLVTVAALPERRGPAIEARACYHEDPEQQAERAARRQSRRRVADAPPTAGRPDKRTRRLMRSRLRGE